MKTNLYELTIKGMFRANDKSGASRIAQKILDRAQVEQFEFEPIITGMRNLGRVNDDACEKINRVAQLYREKNKCLQGK